jgi:hypothetical protein
VWVGSVGWREGKGGAEAVVGERAVDGPVSGPAGEGGCVGVGEAGMGEEVYGRLGEAGEAGFVFWRRKVSVGREGEVGSGLTAIRRRGGEVVLRADGGGDEGEVYLL